ncbi:hypothetical protein Tco_1071476, partial [Tanacetum coccineum]
MTRSRPGPRPDPNPVYYPPDLAVDWRSTTVDRWLTGGPAAVDRWWSGGDLAVVRRWSAEVDCRCPSLTATVDRWIAGTRFLEGYVACSRWWIQLAYE